MKRQRWKSGDLVKIPLSNSTHCYGWVIRAGLIEFLDMNARENIDIDVLVRRPKLFTLLVFRPVITKGEWEIVGNFPRNDEQDFFHFFMQDMFTKELSIYSADKISDRIEPATFEECENLERMAVWNACHVEDRLISHFGGTPRFPVDVDRPVRVLN